MSNVKTIRDFEEFIENSGYTKDRKLKLNNIIKKINVWEAASKKRLWEFDKSLIMEFCEKGVDKNIHSGLIEMFGNLTAFKPILGKSYFGLCKDISALNEVLSFFGREDIIIDINDFSNAPSKEEDLYFKEDIINICNALTNPQDKFIIYGMFCGIKGKDYSDLVNLESKNVDFENKIIKLPSGIEIKMDEYLEDVLRDTLSEFGLMYYSISKAGDAQGVHCYHFNENSPYVIKTRPSVSNNDGCTPMAYQGIQTRLKNVSGEAHRKLTGVNIYKSGIIYRMNQIKNDWTQSEVQEYLDQNGLKLNAFETKRIFDNKYNNK